MKSVSVVVPCRNEEKYIALCLDSLLTNGFPIEYLEILVVDGNSEDRTLPILRDFEEHYPGTVRMIPNPEKVTPRALNIGLQEARHELVMIASAHASFEKGYIETLVKYFDKLKAAAVGGVMETRAKNDTEVTRALVKILSSQAGVGNAMFRVGVPEPVEVDTVPFGIYDKAFLQQVGGYDERLNRNQDIELSKRILRNGGRIFLIPDAKCFYYVRESYGMLALNNYRNGFWNFLVIYMTHNFGSLSLRHFIPALFLLSLFLPLLLAFVSSAFVGITLLSLLAYGLVISREAWKLKDAHTGFWPILWGFISLHFAYGAGSLAGMLRVDKCF